MKVVNAGSRIGCFCCTWRFEESQKLVVHLSISYFWSLNCKSVSGLVSHYLFLSQNLPIYGARLCPCNAGFLVEFFNFPKLELLNSLIKIFKFHCCFRFCWALIHSHLAQFSLLHVKARPFVSYLVDSIEFISARHFAQVGLGELIFLTLNHHLVSSKWWEFLTTE